MGNDRISEPESVLPPDKQDVLFRSEKNLADANMGAVVGDWIYMAGFRRAAQRLSELTCDAESDRDFLIYPIVYLYRHYIELVLKSIFVSASGLLDCALTEDNRKTLGRHGLLQLWQATRPLLNSVCDLAGSPRFLEAELEGIDSYISQIHEHDPEGQSFRYATRRVKSADYQGAKAPSPSFNLKLTNIREMAVSFERLASYLEGLEWWFTDLEGAYAEATRYRNVGSSVPHPGARL